MRVYARVYVWANSHPDTRPAHTAGTRTPEDERKPPEKRGTPANIKQNLLLLGDLNAKNEKKLKKVCKYGKRL